MASLDQNAIASTTSCADHHLHRHLLISPCTEVRYVYQAVVACAHHEHKLHALLIERCAIRSTERRGHHEERHSNEHSSNTPQILRLAPNSNIPRM